MLVHLSESRDDEGTSHWVSMAAVIENDETKTERRVIQRRIIQPEDAQYPSGDRYSLYHGWIDGGGTILRYDNENETPGRHERHSVEGTETIEFTGAMPLRGQFIREVESH
jgi:hypothetical protein